MLRRIIAVATLVLLIAAVSSAQNSKTNDRWAREPGFRYPVSDGDYMPVPFKPRQYVAYRVDDGDAVMVDGKIDETSWDNAEWTDNFTHIVFKGYKNPVLNTRAKMLWDDECMYFAGYLEEPNIYAQFTMNDTVICRESDFEIFIDCDGDARKYIEIEFNAIGTVWDIMYEKELDKGALPYSFHWVPGSKPWDVKGMRLAVRADGSVNYPYDVDEGWAFECSIPWDTLEETNLSGKPLARNGTSMRVNFSRVQSNIRDHWPVEDWKVIRSVDWLWSPMLTYRAHITECFGRVILADRSVLRAKDNALEEAYPFVDPPKKPKRPKVGSMVRIKGGTYTIGPDLADPSGASPAGEVTVDDFYIDRYEVTIGEYVKFLNDGVHDEFYWEDMGDPDWCGIQKRQDGTYYAVKGKELYPVCLLKIEGAKAYAAWAGKRLPSEYEWEIAARGAEGRAYPWGNEAPDDSRANFDYRVGHTTPVGSYPKGRTPDGIYDMAGNVNEMIDAPWAEYPWGVIRPKEQKPCIRPLCRGGAWTMPAINLNATYRDVVKSHLHAPLVGFRCAKDAK